jgi:tRNA(His) 5'-end guanylyltransferase
MKNIKMNKNAETSLIIQPNGGVILQIDSKNFRHKPIN